MVGNIAGNFDATIHRAGMHDQRVGLGQGEPAFIQPIEMIKFTG